MQDAQIFMKIKYFQGLYDLFVYEQLSFDGVWQPG